MGIFRAVNLIYLFSNFFLNLSPWKVSVAIIGGMFNSVLEEHDSGIPFNTVLGTQ